MKYLEIGAVSVWRRLRVAVLPEALCPSEELAPVQQGDGAVPGAFSGLARGLGTNLRLWEKVTVKTNIHF